MRTIQLTHTGAGRTWSRLEHIRGRAEPHSRGHTAAAVQLRLDHGKKWQIDEVLRRDM